MAEKNLQKLNWRGRVFRYAPLVLWIGLILFLSSGQASMSNTSRFLRPFLEFLFPSASIETIDAYHAFIRKFAHLTEYAILAFWASRAFFASLVNILHHFWYVFTFILVVLVASIDETNQSFITSRTGSVYDVVLDVAGGTAMIITYFLISKYRSRRTN